MLEASVKVAYSILRSKYMEDIEKKRKSRMVHQEKKKKVQVKKK